jgi:tRNA A-37 threonylcarbamoyl transferase component Bud32
MSQAIDLTSGGVRWSLQRNAPDHDGAWRVEDLFGPEGLRLGEWLASGRASVVKEGPHRTVYRILLRKLDFHLKHYRLTSRRGRLQALVRPSKARRECERALTVAARQVPTLTPFAVGEIGLLGGPGGSFLATYTLRDTQPLSEFLEHFGDLPPARRTRLRQRLAVALGRLLAQMHHAGITQSDLHPGNLLLRLEADDTPRLFLIDLHTVHLGPPLSWPAARANLVVMNRWFMLRAERSDRRRFFHAYSEAVREIARGEGVEGWGAEAGPPCTFTSPRHQVTTTVKDLERRTLASNLRFWRQHDRRCLGQNRYFQRLRSSLVIGHAVADLDPNALAPLLADPDAPFRRSDVTILKDSPTSNVVEFDLPGSKGLHRVIYKRFPVASWTDPWVALVRSTPALRSYVLGHGLRLRCLPTPRPLAVWHHRRKGLLHEGYLLTEKVPDALDLVAFVASLDALPARERRLALRRLIDQVARLVGTLHHRHLSHRDLKAANLLVSTEQWFASGRGTKERGRGPGPVSPGAMQVWFIDLVGVRRHFKLRRHRRLQNLARLHASFHCHPALTRTDKLRFLRLYLRWGLRGRIGWKRWWRQLEEATKTKVERNLRNGRPLG